jgi:branched-chain amino acid aminotransferase
MEQLPKRVFDEGCSVIVSEHLRQFPLSKTTNYIQAVLLQEERKSRGALEVLYTWQGNVLECATSNFFIVKDGKIITPKEDILMGITRKAAMVAAGNHFPIEERAVSVDEMYAADEAFLTSSFKDVVPVVNVGGRAIADGKPGPVTREVMRLFHELTQSQTA